MFALSRCDYHNDDHPDNQHVVDKWSCFCHQFLCQCKTLVSAQEMKMWTSFWCNSISPLSIFIMAGCGDDNDSDTVFLKRTIMMIKICSSYAMLVVFCTAWPSWLEKTDLKQWILPKTLVGIDYCLRCPSGFQRSRMICICAKYARWRWLGGRRGKVAWGGVLTELEKYIVYIVYIPTL